MAYGLTQSANLVAASSQRFTAADSASLSITGNMTIELWVKFASLPSSGSNFSLVSKYATTGTTRSYLFSLNNTSGTYSLFAQLSANGTTHVDQAIATWSPSTGTWYHIAMVYTAATGGIEAFVNGSSIGSNTGWPTSINDNGTTVYISGLNDGGFIWGMDGKLSLVRLWNTTRNATQLQANMCAVLGATTNLAAEWTLNNSLLDNSGNSNTLTNVNTATFSADVPSTCTSSGPTGIKTWDGLTAQ